MDFFYNFKQRCVNGNKLLYTIVFVGIILIILLCKTYLHSVLIWLEIQDIYVISLTTIVLYTIAALPIALGYIVIVLACGYLFGFFQGIAFTVLGANLGLFFAHNILRIVIKYRLVPKLPDTEMVQTLLRLISGPLAFKIVICSRFTPIPFGLQNTIFAMSDISPIKYHLASLLGLLPAQSVVVYAGSTLRSMQDVIENRTISTGTYVFAIAQIVLAVALLVWVGNKARKEILKIDKDTITNSYRIV